ncbi:MAG: HupE/UreJ family protein [Xanthobacteraceae bacterium]
MTRRLVVITAALTLLASTPAFAHLNPVEHGSLSAGLSHPFSGTDHILAMVGVGLWAALLGGRAIWAVPAAFLIAMMAGFAAALVGAPLPFVEPVIAASVVVLGLLALVALQVPTYVGMAMVGFFALFHGYAHGGELGEAGALPFMAGFALATAILHGIGVAIGLGAARFGGTLVTRLVGGLTALGGLWLFAGM